MKSVSPLVDPSGSSGTEDQKPSWTTVFTSHSPAGTVQRLMFCLLVSSVVALCIANPLFRSTRNLLNIVQQASMVGVIACGMQFMILAGGFDLSVGIVAAAAGCAGAFVSLSQGVALGIGAGLVVGVLCGVVNGILVARIGINPFIATFGTQAVVTGFLFAATDGRPISPIPSEWRLLGNFNLVGVSFASLVFVVVTAVLYFVLRYTRYGQHVYAVGSNAEGARRAGVQVNRVLITTYAIGGLSAGIAGILLVAISGVGSPSAGANWALLAIAAVVLGGTPLSGGVGGMSSAILGILSLTLLSNVLTLYGIAAFWQPAVMGLGVLGAVAFESYRGIRRS